MFYKNLKFNSVLKTNQTSNQNSPTRKKGQAYARLYLVIKIEITSLVNILPSMEKSCQLESLLALGP